MSEPPLDPLARQFRQHSGKLSRQAAVSLAGNLFLASGGYLFKIYVSRVLGARGLGIYALGMTTIGFFSLFATLGVPQAAARFVAIYRGAGEGGKVRRLFRRGLATVAAASGLLAVLMVAGGGWLVGSFYNVPELEPYLPYFALILILSAIQVFLGQYVRGLQKVAGRIFITHFVGFPVKVLVTVALISVGWGLRGYVAAELVSMVVIILLMAVLVRRLTPGVLSFGTAAAEDSVAASPARDEAVYGLSMMGLSFLGFLGGRIDVILLGIFLAASEIGVYSIALTTSVFVPTLLKALNSIFGPIIADLHARRQIPLLRRLFQTSTKWCFSFTWPLVIVIVFFARELMALFGPEFEAGAPVLALLAVGQLVNVAVGSVGNLLVMSGHQRLEIRIAVSIAALGLVLNVVLIPRWGIVGAAVALTLNMIAANLMRAWLVWVRLKLLPYNRQSLRLALPFAASILLTFGVWWWWRPRIGFEILPAALAGAYVVFLVTAAAFALDRDDRIILQAVAEKVRGFLRR